MTRELEFHYRLPGRSPGARPGAHSGSGLGGASEFVAHRRLFERPDPRRLDLRASLAQRALAGDWLVRVNRQRAGITVQLLADVSASMHFGADPAATKLRRVAAFAESLGHSAARLGDAVGLTPFDGRRREDLLVPPSRHRGLALQMAARLREATPAAGPQDGARGLADALAHLPGRPSLVFLASDFHWPLERLPALLDQLSGSHVVPVLVWDAAETEPPAGNGLAMLSDAENGHRRTLWLRPSLRQRWREAVAQRRDTLRQLFTRRGLRPFEMGPHFEPAALSKHFLESVG
jgi:uncharacterized protein with von Willebrand factor type A (vWA) domain